MSTLTQQHPAGEPPHTHLLPPADDASPDTRQRQQETSEGEREQQVVQLPESQLAQARSPIVDSPVAAQPAVHAGSPSPAASASPAVSLTPPSDSSQTFPVFRNQVAGHAPLLWHKGTICKPLQPTEYAFYAHLIPGELSALVPYTPKFYGILDMSFIPEAFEKQKQEQDQRRAEKALVLEKRREEEARLERERSAKAAAAAAGSSGLLSPPSLPSSVSIPLSLSSLSSASSTHGGGRAVAPVPSLPHSRSSSPLSSSRGVSMNTWVLQCQNRTRDKNNRLHSADDAAAENMHAAAADATAAAATAATAAGKAHTLPASFDMATANAQQQQQSQLQPPQHPSDTPSSPPTASSTPAPAALPPIAVASPAPSSLPQYIVLEDLTFAYDRPCILDLKLGTRQHGIHDSAKKVASKIEKCAKTTSGKLGIRLCGMQVFHPAQPPAAAAAQQKPSASGTENQQGGEEGKFIYYDKYYGRSLTEESFVKTLKLFFWNGHKLLLHVMLLFLERLAKLKRILELPSMSKYRFYSSSLLMVYEGQTNRTDSATMASAAAAAAAAAAATGSSATFPVQRIAQLPPSASDGNLAQAALSNAAGSGAVTPAGKEHYPAAASLSSCSRLNDIVERSLSFAGSASLTGNASSSNMTRSQSIDFHNVGHGSSPSAKPTAAPSSTLSASQGRTPSGSHADLDSGLLTPPAPRRTMHAAGDESPQQHHQPQGATIDGAASPATGSSPLPPMHPTHPSTAAAAAAAPSSATAAVPVQQHLDLEDILELRQILAHEAERVDEIRRGYHALVEQKQREEMAEAERRTLRVQKAAQVARVAAQAIAASASASSASFPTSSSSSGTLATVPEQASVPQQQQHQLDSITTSVHKHNEQVLASAARVACQEASVVSVMPAATQATVSSAAAAASSAAAAAGTICPAVSVLAGRVSSNASTTASGTPSSTGQTPFSPSEHISYMHVAASGTGTGAAAATTGGGSATTNHMHQLHGAGSTAGPSTPYTPSSVLTPHPSPQPPSPFPIPPVDSAEVPSRMLPTLSSSSSHSMGLPSSRASSAAYPLSAQQQQQQQQQQQHSSSPLPPHPYSLSPAVTSSVVLPPASVMSSTPTAPAAAGATGAAGGAGAPKLYTRVRKTTHAVARERARLKGNIDIRLIDYAQVVLLEAGEEKPLVRDPAAEEKKAQSFIARAQQEAMQVAQVNNAMADNTTGNEGPTPLQPPLPARPASTDPSSPSPAAGGAPGNAVLDGGLGDPGLLIGVTNLIYFISNVVTQEIEQMLRAERLREQQSLLAGSSSSPAMAPAANRSRSRSASENGADAEEEAAEEPPLRGIPALGCNGGVIARCGRSAAAALFEPCSPMLSTCMVPLPATCSDEVMTAGSLLPGHSSPMASSSHTAAFSSSHVPPRKHTTSSSSSTGNPVAADSLATSAQQQAAAAASVLASELAAQQSAQ